MRLPLPLSLLFVAAVPVSLAAQVQVSRDSVVTASASRVTRVPPDRVSFYLVVEGTAETPADAVARVDSKVKAVQEALKGFGSRVKVDQPVAYGVGPSPNLSGFPGATNPGTNLARSVIHVQLDRPEQTAQVVAAAIGAGASSSSSLSFEASAADSVRRTRITEVLGVARRDAETIAESLGGRLGGLVSVTTGGSGVGGFPMSSMLNFDIRFGQQSQTPDVAVTTTVTVQYRIVR